MAAAPVIALLPESDPGLAAAVEAGGGRVGPLEDAEGAILHRFGEGDPDASAPGVERLRWLQLPAAGVESWLDALPDGPVVTSATGAFALPVAEHALALLLVAARSLHLCARATEWTEPRARSLEGATVAIVGAGGIGRALIELLTPLSPRILAVTRRGLPVDRAAVTVPADRVDEVLAEAEYVVLAAPSTGESRRLIDAERLALMREGAWLVNVGRGTLVDTDALVAALDEGRIGGAALDVTDPEPLPPGHPLWGHPRAMITPHIATTDGAERVHYERRVRDNVARFAAGEPLLGVVDRDAGY
jgi:phosphoglycerate dehydrogenase-like enzyme